MADQELREFARRLFSGERASAPVETTDDENTTDPEMRAYLAALFTSED